MTTDYGPEILAGFEKLFNKLDEAKNREGGPGEGPTSRAAGTTFNADIEAKALDRATKALALKVAAGEKLVAVEQQLQQDLEAQKIALDEITEAIANNADNVDELIGNYDRLGIRQKKFRDEIKAGTALSKNYENALFKVSGAFGELYTNYIPKTAGELKGLGKSLQKNVLSVEGLRHAAVALTGIFFNMAMASDKSLASFRANTGAGMEYKTVMNGVRNQSRAAGVSFEEASKSMESLYTNMSGFTELSESEQTNLTNTVALMNELGVSTDLTSKVMDTATKSLGYSASETAALADTLKDTAISLGKPINDVVSDFASAAPKLAFYGKKMMNVFQALEKQSKATGLSIDQILGLTGEQFDTFEGAGQAVGKLNAILGGPYLNSIDMVNASEEKRMEMLKGAVDASGVIFSDLNKYEQKMFASAMGTDVDTLRRAMGNLSAAEELSIQKQEKLAKLAANTKSVMDELRNALRSLVTDNKDLFDSMVKTIKSFSEFLQGLDETDKKLITLTAKVVIFGGLLTKLYGTLKMLGIIKVFAAGIGLLNTAVLSFIPSLTSLAVAWNLSPFVLVSIAVAALTLLGAHIYNMNEAGYDMADMLKDLASRFMAPVAAIISFVKRLREGQDAMAAFKETAKDFLNNISFGLAGSALGFGTNIERKKGAAVKYSDTVGDAVITKRGDVIKVNDQDDIIAAKPKGPIMSHLSKMNESNKEAVGMGGLAGLLGQTPLAMLGSALMGSVLAPILKEAITDPVVRALGGDKGEINVVVKIGEKELDRQIIEALSSNTAMESMGPYALR